MAQCDPLTDDEWADIDAIDGWLFREEAELLRSLNVGTWCELGSWKGRSTRVLAATSRGYAIDWFQGIVDPEYGLQNTNTLADFLANTAPCRHNITMIALPFQRAISYVTEPLDLLFLDAEHNYTLTREAFELYSPKVRVGGYAVFHDAWGEHGERVVTPLPEVTEYVNELRGMRNGWRHVERLDAARCAVLERIS